MTEDRGQKTENVRRKAEEMNVEHRTSNAKRRVSSIEYRASRPAFSLMEVLIAVGVLAVGMLFIASVFPAGLYWTTITTERTIAPIAAEDAFATIKLYGINIPVLSSTSQTQIESVSSIYSGEYGYPSYGGIETKKYWWSAICRKVDPLDPCNVQITIFVSRKVGSGTQYPNTIDPNRPVAVKIAVALVGSDLQITSAVDRTLINDGYTVVDDSKGDIYRVLERYRLPNDNIIRLDKNWQGASTGSVWVIPPPVGGGRSPCIAVYQKMMRF
jgi:prepilin-type N-terminal cleavage/methylation domain-containing protein